MPDDAYLQIILLHDIYDRAAVVEAAQVYAAHHLHVAVLSTSADETEIAIRTSPQSPEAEQVMREFLNHVLDLSIRRKLGRS